MNERIRQLAEQAGIEWKQQPPHFTNTSNPIDFPVSANRDLEKFAELIVRECIQELEISKKCDPYTGDLFDCEYNTCIKEQSIMLKEHFGVEL